MLLFIEAVIVNIAVISTVFVKSTHTVACRILVFSATELHRRYERKRRRIRSFKVNFFTWRMAQDGIKKTHWKKRRNKKKEKGRGHHKRNKNCKYDEKVRGERAWRQTTPLYPLHIASDTQIRQLLTRHPRVMGTDRRTQRWVTEMMEKMQREAWKELLAAGSAGWIFMNPAFAMYVYGYANARSIHKNIQIDTRSGTYIIEKKNLQWGTDYVVPLLQFVYIFMVTFLFKFGASDITES